MRYRVLWSAIVTTSLLGLGLSAQSPRPAFEVASVKMLASPAQGFPRVMTDRGTFSIPSTNVAYLIQFAYQIRDDYIVDAPAWVRSDVFEVNARAGRDATTDEMRPMVQSLLANRFGLVAVTEQRTMPHFALVSARPDGTLGPQLHKVDDCRGSLSSIKWPTPPPGASTGSGCGSLANFVTSWSRYVGAPIVDRTGLTGSFRYRLYHSPADRPVIPGLPLLSPVIGPEADNLPSFRDALRDQLGLRVESIRGPLDVLVIKSVQQPTEN